MLIIKTGRINQHGENITIKKNPSHVLAPLWSMVLGHKEGRLTDRQYFDRYMQLLLDRYAFNENEFLELIQRDEITLLCFCPTGQFCHRHIAAQFLKWVAIKHNIEATIIKEETQP